MKILIKIIAAALLALILNGNIQAQIKITTLRGDILMCTDYKIDSTIGFPEIAFQVKKKLKTLETQDVFSIDDPAKGKVIFYQPLSNDELSIENMQQMVKGRIEGNKGNKFWGSFLFTYTATTLTGFIENGQIFIAPVVPLATTITIGIFSKNEKAPENFDEYMKEGYIERRAFRRIKASLIGAAAGLVSSLALHEIIY